MRSRLEERALRARDSLAETGEWIERREHEIEQASLRRGELTRQMQQAEDDLAVRLREEEEARVAGEQLRDGYEREAEAVRSVENDARNLRSELNRGRESASSAEMVEKEAELRLQHQSQAIRDKWSVDIATWAPPALDLDAEGGVTTEVGETPGQDLRQEETDDLLAASDSGAGALREARRNAELARLPRQARESELEKVRQGIESLGDVNVGAIEEHEELAERFRFLAEQKDDLEGTITSLREAIARINRTSRRRFRETFELISKHFSENFPRLFGGGKASLMLCESEDILEAGVDIMAMPPGKRLQNVNLLSGGEKTLAALALLVAVFQVRPSPFFLLDEVDAALDDANVGRFNQLIGELAKESQFLVITHNKRTIEVSDVLYGVTMEQKGVSKLVSVALH
jgi:chromosome segregation protein